MSIAYQYTADGYYAGPIEDYGLLPHGATRMAPDIRDGFVPRWTGAAWEQVEDHRGKTGYVNGQAVELREPGPLPDGWSDTPPPPSLTDAKVSKAAAVRRAYDAALTATLTMPADNPGGAELALAAQDFARDDPQGLADVRAILDARRAALLEAVEAARTVEEVQAVTVSYPV